VIVSALLVACLIGLLLGSARWPAVAFAAALLLFLPPRLPGPPGGGGGSGALPHPLSLKGKHTMNYVMNALDRVLAWDLPDEACPLAVAAQARLLAGVRPEDDLD
jgi:hypothetical protein